MIEANGSFFALHTEKTTYLFAVSADNRLVSLHYGPKIPVNADIVAALLPRSTNPPGCSVIASTDTPSLCLDDLPREYSGKGKGDFREPLADISFPDGSRTTDFRYTGYRLEQTAPTGLPSAKDGEGLVIVLRDGSLELELHYGVYAHCDCITRFSRLINHGEQPVTIHRLMSAQLDLPGASWKITTFHGDWAREMDKKDILLSAGKYISDSTTGFSSNRANPFVMFGAPDAGEYAGRCYAANLLYSGSHRECFEIASQGGLRMLTGIHPDFFTWTLEANASFDAPQAVLTVSDSGYAGISEHMHAFVRGHIVPEYFRDRSRPVLVNSWEAMYFDISERKLLRLAREGKKVGAELFVLDDGWFGHRDDDRSSLGDWFDYTQKLPNGIAGLSRAIHDLGMQFGIWVEPEMVSEDSELYRTHPEWAVRIPGREHSLGRNQMLLDLSCRDVQDYLIDAMTDVFTRGSVDYVKWDMNRNFSDCFSQNGTPTGEFSHRYILGLYRVMRALMEKFPRVLFEGCASGGNRFDLGILSYFPQIWASDNTDALCRAAIQSGYSYGYPQSVQGAHVSASPNHQTLRCTPLETRFAVACAGLLGYELNLCDQSAETLEEIRNQIAWYKQYRQVAQYGTLHRLPFTGDADILRWCIVSQDRKTAIVLRVQGHVRPNAPHHSLMLRGLNSDFSYRLHTLPRKFDIHRMGDLVNTLSPVHIRQDSLLHDVVARFVKLDGEVEDRILPGSVLMSVGVPLADSYAGTGMAENTAIYQDSDARIYLLEAVEEQKELPGVI